MKKQRMIVLILSLMFVACESTERLDRGLRVADQYDDKAYVFRAAPKALTGAVKLADLLVMAEQHNASLLREAYSTRVAEAKKQEFLARIFSPQGSLSTGGFVRSNTPKLRASVLGQRFKVPLGVKDYVFAQGTLRQPLLSVSDQFFRLSAASLNVKARQLGFLRARQLIRLKVINSFFAVLILKGELSSVKALIKSLKEREKESEILLKNGRIIKNEVLQVQVELRDQEQSAIELRNAIRLNKLDLCQLAGAPVTEGFSFSWSRTMPAKATMPSSRAAFQKAMKNRPDLLALELQQQSAKRSATAEWFDYLPRIDGIVSYEWLDQDNLVEDDFFGLTVLGSVDFLDLSRHARNRQFTEQANSIKAQGLELERQIRFEVEQACLAIDNEINRRRQAQLASEAAQENVKVERLRFKNGKSTANDLLDAETRLVTQQINIIRARYRYYSNLALLEFVAGIRNDVFTK